ncbi:MAG: hypothetical protein ACLQU3_33005 [Limisphaerales bacterium]
MKFGSDQAARRRVLEAGQQYRGVTFTDRGDLLLDVGSVQDGRVILSQHGRSIRLLPETLSSIHRAWRDGDIPLDGNDNWECSTFSPGVADVDEIRCICPSKDQLLVTNKISQTVVSVTREQLNVVVERIVDPWLASFSPSHPAAAPAQSAGEGPRRNLDSPKPAPPLELS